MELQQQVCQSTRIALNASVVQAERLAWIKLRHLQHKLVACGRTLHSGLCAKGYAMTALAASDAVLATCADRVLTVLKACLCLVRGSYSPLIDCVNRSAVCADHPKTRNRAISPDVVAICSGKRRLLPTSLFQ